MEFIGYMIMLILFIYVLDTNSKVKTLYRKIYLEDENDKGNTFRILKQNIGETIQISIKESYSEFGQMGDVAFDTIGENKVTVLSINKDWVHLKLHGKQIVEKLIRIESIALIDVGKLWNKMTKPPVLQHWWFSIIHGRIAYFLVLFLIIQWIPTTLYLVSAYIVETLLSDSNKL